MNPPRCEEGRDIDVRFRFPPQLRIVGDLQATTETLVMTALAFAATRYDEFRSFAVDVSMDDDQEDGPDLAAAAVFAQLQPAEFLRWLDALEPS